MIQHNVTQFVHKYRVSVLCDTTSGNFVYDLTKVTTNKYKINNQVKYIYNTYIDFNSPEKIITLISKRKLSNIKYTIAKLFAKE